jgi:hypothetical protein
LSKEKEFFVLSVVNTNIENPKDLPLIPYGIHAILEADYKEVMADAK